MQKWDYKTLYRGRGWKPFDGDVVSHASAGEWDYWAEDDTEIPMIRNIERKIKELGQQGWELVEIVTRSSYFGGKSTLNKDFAGLTTGELWVFKRPIQ